MDDLMDMIASDESPSQITDKIKEILFSKSSERVNELRPYVASSLFGEEDSEDEDEDEDLDDDEDEDEEYFGDDE